MIKPCPRCGAVATFQAGQWGIAIDCSICEITMCALNKQTKEQLIEEWNIRTLQDEEGLRRIVVNQLINYGAYVAEEQSSTTDCPDYLIRVRDEILTEVRKRL
jgi:hypothetical protein